MGESAGRAARLNATLLPERGGRIESRRRLSNCGQASSPIRYQGFSLAFSPDSPTAEDHTELGFDERYVVESKDRYLEERFYFDEWDKGLSQQALTRHVSHL